MAGRSEGLAIEPLWHAADAGGPTGAARAGVESRGGLLPPELARRHPGELAIALLAERPTVIANFVSSVDGVVALGPSEPAAGGGEISGFSHADRYMMALLRALADVVIVGAGTVRVGSKHRWTAGYLQPALGGEFAAWRSELWLSAQPTTIVVTASGKLDPNHPGLSTPDVPVIIATTSAGAERLNQRPLPANMKVEAVGAADRVPAGAILDLVQRTGARLALCEGGPHLFGELLRARLIDELFLTMAPQIIGRDSSAQRLALVEGTSFGEGHGRWSRLIDVRHAGDDLFLRYRFEP
jgi:riboflavin biosynthesis pyrimidine reductase